MNTELVRAEGLSIHDLSIVFTLWILSWPMYTLYQLERTGYLAGITVSIMYIHHLCHSKFTELCNTTACCWYLWISIRYTWAEFRACFPSCPDFLTSASSVPPWACSLFKCCSVANTSPFSAVCSWIRDLITVAFQHCRVWPRQMNLPRLARSPGSHLGKWKIQAVPGKKSWTCGHD